MIETRRLKNVIFLQTILSFLLSRKITNPEILWKMDIVKMTHFTLLVELKLWKSNFYYGSVTLKLIEVKRKVSSKRVLRLFFTTFRRLYEASPGRSPGPADIVVEALAKNCSRPFCIHQKEKDWKILLPAWLKMKCSGASFCIFYWSKNIRELS